ncbi:MAG: hypothetical protein M3Z75_27660 [Actinomycetota bacterium]|nr:hypothetical protein [Actinomycetota bacterium]
MLLVLGMDVADLAAIRFAISPLRETLKAVQLLARPDLPPVNRPGGGARSPFGDLHPDLRWTAGKLFLAASAPGYGSRSGAGQVTLGPDSVVLMPSRGRMVLYQASPLGLALLGQAELGTAELGTAELGTAELGTAELGTAELGTAELGTAGS